MKRPEVIHHHSDFNQPHPSFNISSLYRVWPDGTVQDVDEGEPYPWMSDDFLLVIAPDEDAALRIADV